MSIKKHPDLKIIYLPANKSHLIQKVSENSLITLQIPKVAFWLIDSNSYGKLFLYVRPSFCSI